MQCTLLWVALLYLRVAVLSVVQDSDQPPGNNLRAHCLRHYYCIPPHHDGSRDHEVAKHPTAARCHTRVLEHSPVQRRRGDALHAAPEGGGHGQQRQGGYLRPDPKRYHPTVAGGGKEVGRNISRPSKIPWC